MTPITPLHILIRCILLLFIGCLLAGCRTQYQLADNFETYLKRVASVLEVSPPPDGEAPLLSYPEKSTLTVEREQISIRLTEFYSLQACPVNSLIAERNTALGKLQLPSRRYVYEVKLIKGLQDCLKRQSDENASLPLKNWLALKQRQLPEAWADVVQNSSEMKRAMASNSGYISGTQDDNFAAFYQAFIFINGLHQSPSEDINAIEQQLKIINKTPLLARMWASQALLLEKLKRSSEWMGQHTASLSCERPSKKQQIERLENVFNRYFVTQIQAVASKLNDYHYKLLPSLNYLAQREELADSFKLMLKQHQNTFTDYQDAMAEHIKIWQSILNTCR